MYKNAVKRENSVSSSVTSRKRYTVQICLSPNCLCPDFQKNGSGVSCKYMSFLPKYVLQTHKNDTLLKARYFSDDDIKVCFRNNSINPIDQEYVQKVENICRNKRNMLDIPKNHPLYNQPQKLGLCARSIANNGKENIAKDLGCR